MKTFLIAPPKKSPGVNWPAWRVIKVFTLSWFSMLVLLWVTFFAGFNFALGHTGWFVFNLVLIAVNLYMYRIPRKTVNVRE